VKHPFGAAIAFGDAVALRSCFMLKAALRIPDQSGRILKDSPDPLARERARRKKPRATWDFPEFPWNPWADSL